jgi:hypothetical protein
MKINEALGALMAIAGCALLAGAGFLAYQIGATWTETTTQSLVTGLVAVCGGGAVVIALILSLIVGVPMATRFFAEGGRARREWRDTPPTFVQLPPAPEAQAWDMTGGGHYQLMPPMQQDSKYRLTGESGPTSDAMKKW